MKKSNTLFACAAFCVLTVMQVYAQDADSTNAVACLGKVVPGARVSKLAAESLSGTQCIVDSLNVARGDKVEKNSVVASIKGHERAKSAVERAKAALAVAESARDIKILQQKNLIADLEGTFAQNQKVIDEKDPPRREREQLEYEQESLSRRISQAKAMLPLVEKNETAIVNEAKTALKESELAYEGHFVKAPISGVVVETHIRVGEAVGMEGICEIADTNSMYVDAEVYVSDVSKIKVGDKAEIFSDALGQERFSGTVTEISNFVRSNRMFSTDPGEYSNLRVVVVKIRLDNPQKFKGLIGSQVNVRILTDKA